MKLINKYILLFAIALGTLISIQRFAMPDHADVFSNNISNKTGQFLHALNISSSMFMVEDKCLENENTNETDNNDLSFYFCTLLALSPINDHNADVFVNKNISSVKHIRERDKYQLYLSLQVPS